MKTISKTLGILAFAVLMPFTVSGAMAAQAPDTLTVTTPTNTVLKNAAVTQSKGLVEKTVKPETIKVAGRRGRGLALGIIAGVATAAILSGAARSHHYDSHYGYRHSRAYRRHQRRCNRWAHRCDYGNDRACHEYYTHCE